MRTPGRCMASFYPSCIIAGQNSGITMPELESYRPLKQTALSGHTGAPGASRVCSEDQALAGEQVGDAVKTILAVLKESFNAIMRGDFTFLLYKPKK